MKHIWQFIKDKHAENQKVILLVVIDNQGSSPGQPGFKMAVSANGSMTGSIGGGETEFRLVEMAKTMLKTGEHHIMLKREIHRPGEGGNNSGMICSGEQWVGFYPIEENDVATIGNILSSLEKGEKGMIHYDQTGFIFKEGESDHHKHQHPVTSPNEWIWSESTGITNRLYVFGGGHVGLAVSNIASKVGFKVHIFDDRKDLYTLNENNSAESKAVIDYKSAGDHIPEGDHIFVVIMTFGHKSDEVVLRQCIHKKVKYLGMMGSKNKVSVLFANLEKGGIKNDVLQKVHAPVGLPISSQTPYEIAVSIIAEMVAVKNNPDLIPKVR